MMCHSHISNKQTNNWKKRQNQNNNKRKLVEENQPKFSSEYINIIQVKKKDSIFFPSFILNRCEGKTTKTGNFYFCFCQLINWIERKFMNQMKFLNSVCCKSIHIHNEIRINGELYWILFLFCRKRMMIFSHSKNYFSLL